MRAALIGGELMYEKHIRWGRPALAILTLLMVGWLPLAQFHNFGHTATASTAVMTTMPTGQLRGIAYGPFREGQSPEWGIYPTLDQVRQDMPLLRLVANGARIYGCQHSETVITATREASLPLALGAWMSGNSAEDSAEIACAASQAQANSHITSIVVGNESILSGQLTVAQVCSYTQQVRDATGLPITTAEPWHIWIDNPALVACVDYLLVHIHPYWECQPIENAVGFVQEKHAQVGVQYPGKALVIGETGWPTAGSGREGHCGVMSIPTPDQQSLFATGFLDWAEQEGVDFYYFEAFDEPWKCTGGRAEVECHWGLYDADRAPKPAQRWFIPYRLWLPLVLQGY
jgi:exo-beta-1,3-glucanase (GH17 family)